MHSDELAFRLATVFFLLVQSVGPATQQAFVPLIQALDGFHPTLLIRDLYLLFAEKRYCPVVG